MISSSVSPENTMLINITPEGISRYTDGRVIVAGDQHRCKQGRKSPVPCHALSYLYGHMDEEDVKCIIAYLRTLKPIKNVVPESESDFPMSFIINTIPEKASFTKKPAPQQGC